MNELLQSYRSLPAGRKVLVGGVALVVAILLLANLPHILWALLGVGLALILLALWVLALVGIGLAIYFAVRAVRSRS
jgi:hypothetical protein